MKTRSKFFAFGGLVTIALVMIPILRDQFYLNQMEMQDLLVTVVFPTMGTLPVAAILCRFRVAHSKPVSYGTVMGAVGLVAIAWLIVVTHGECFTSEFWGPWRPKRTVWTQWIGIVGFVASICVLPALGVVAYYRKRSLIKVRTVAEQIDCTECRDDAPVSN